MEYTAKPVTVRKYRAWVQKVSGRPRSEKVRLAAKRAKARWERMTATIH